eukprot:5812276-Pyramimonas_sp.AAC.1
MRWGWPDASLPHYHPPTGHGRGYRVQRADRHQVRGDGEGAGGRVRGDGAHAARHAGHVACNY